MSIQRQIKIVEEEIDWLVYELYGLTKEEIIKGMAVNIE